MVDLPEGFTPDEEVGLPEGFIPDEPGGLTAAQQIEVALKSSPSNFLRQLGGLYGILPGGGGAPVDMSHRALINSVTVDPVERKKGFANLGYDASVDPNSKKAMVKGEPVDRHALTPSISELLSEFLENADSVPPMVAAGLSGPYAIPAGAAAAGATALARDQLRQKVIPGAEPEYGPAMLEGGLNLLPGLSKLPGAKKLGGAIKSTSGPVYDKVLKPATDWTLDLARKSKPGRYVEGVAKNIKDASSKTYTKYSGEAFEKLDKTKQNIVRRFDDTFGITADMRNVGLNNDAFNAFNTVDIKENYSRLIAENPAFREMTTTGGTGVRGDMAFDLFQDTGERIGNYYRNNTQEIPLSELFGQKSYKEMTEAIYDQAANSREEVAQLLGVRDDFIRRLYDITARRKLLNDPDTAARAASQGMGVKEYIFNSTPDVSKIPIQELQEALTSTSVKLEDMWELRKVADAMAGWTSSGRWFTDNAGTNPKTTLVYKKFADTLRDTLGQFVDDPNIARDIADYSDMAPIVNAIVQKAAESTGKTFRPNDIYVSAIGGDIYRTLGYASKILRNPSAKGKLSGAFSAAKDILTPDMSTNALREATESAVGSSGILSSPALTPLKMKGVADELSRSMDEDRDLSYSVDQQDDSEALKFLLNRMRGTEQPQSVLDEQVPGGGDLDPTALNRLAPPQAPRPLPRDPELIGSNPEDMGLIATAVSPNTALLFKDAVNSNDPLKRRIATVKVMQEAPELFEPSMYGIRSLIAEGDRFVIGDPQEADMYRYTIQHLKGIGKVDENWYTKQLSALNDSKDMTVYPRPDIVGKEASTEVGEKKSSSLDRISTAAGERRKYNY